MGRVLFNLPGNHYISSNLFEFDGKSLELYPLIEGVYDERAHYPNMHTKMIVWEHFVPLDEYFSFGFVRDPKARMVSLYLQQLKYCADYRGGPTPDVKLDVNDAQSQQTGLPVGQHKFDFEFFVKTYVPTCGSNQVSRMCDRDRNILLDFVGRYEQIEADWAKICGRLGITCAWLPKMNVSDSYEVSHFYTPELLDYMFNCDFYKEEYEVFGYEKR
jgi:hypothetical protein